MPGRPSCCCAAHQMWETREEQLPRKFAARHARKVVGWFEKERLLLLLLLPIFFFGGINSLFCFFDCDHKYAGEKKKGAFELIAKVVAALPTHSQQRPFLLFFHFNFLLFSFVSSDSSQSERKKKKKTEQFFFFVLRLVYPTTFLLLLLLLVIFFLGFFLYRLYRFLLFIYF